MIRKGDILKVVRRHGYETLILGKEYVALDDEHLDHGMGGDEPRVTVLDRDDDQYPYPISCFEKVGRQGVKKYGIIRRWNVGTPDEHEGIHGCLHDTRESAEKNFYPDRGDVAVAEVQYDLEVTT